ncbi:conserved hypothetical protein [Acidovorax delafieldii 2AN]|jgi:hypothetical protein|uniref:Uncharacterized protein n=1 Tax=Acidovorax delafieldii 2AN TaxID=573060 RepID=C5T0D5_ACIDE|nr:hypothetical protein [Acidovorax delafieldii]EER62088.1 conserved hypothetical protein [Acidovorax delafieldii 2AN]
MKTFLIEFDDDETMPDRLRARAAEWGISPEDLIHRAIDALMVDYGLPALPKDFHAKSLRELFEVGGVLKSKT